MTRETIAGRPARVRDRPAVVLALDAGQSGVRARVHREAPPDPFTLGSGVRPLGAPGAVAEIAAILGEAAEGAGGRFRADVAGISLSGFAPGAAEADQLGATLLDVLGAARVVVAHDSVCAHLGALAGGPGVVAAVGTGSVVLGVGPDGTAARVDGAGHLLGDAGSGFAIGRRGLEAALRAHDGRGPAEALRVRAERRFGSLDDLPIALYGAPSPVREVASFARDVAAVARAGDRAARAIWAEAAAEVAGSVLAAVRRTHPGAPGDFCLLGGLFAEVELLRDPVLAAVAAGWPEGRHAAPAGSALDGAERLAAGEGLVSAGGLALRPAGAVATAFGPWVSAYARAGAS